MTIFSANFIREEIGKKLINSLNSPNRYPRGEVKFVESQMVANRILKYLDEGEGDLHFDDNLIEGIEGISPEVSKKLMGKNKGMRISDLLGLSLEAYKELFELSMKDACKLRRAILGLERPDPDPEEKWLGIRKGKKIKTPKLIGLPHLEAITVLGKVELSPGEIKFLDSEQPKGIVIKQVPGEGEETLTSTEVVLFLSSGLSVKLPDVIGWKLSEAIKALCDAGLESEPEIEFQTSREVPKNHVIAIYPEPCLYITPNTIVNLVVSVGMPVKHKNI